MHEELKYVGDWFIPKDQDGNRIKGTLTFKPQERLSLELYGEFDSLESDLRLEPVDLIGGFTSDGKCITLYKCIIVRLKGSFPGSVECTYTANFAFRGVIFEDLSELIFYSLTARISNLNN